MMKIIFLDVDGVLNNDSWCWDLYYKYGVYVYTNNILYEPSLLQLRRIINKTDAKIVVSSAWRKVPSAYSDLLQWLKRYGMEVYDTTPYVGGIRGDDIEAWLKEHDDVESYVILDDDDDMGILYDRLVRTDFNKGLTKEDADICIKMLGGDLSDE